MMEVESAAKMVTGYTLSKFLILVSYVNSGFGPAWQVTLTTNSWVTQTATFCVGIAFFQHQMHFWCGCVTVSSFEKAHSFSLWLHYGCICKMLFMLAECCPNCSPHIHCIKQLEHRYCHCRPQVVMYASYE